MISLKTSGRGGLDTKALSRLSTKDVKHKLKGIAWRRVRDYRREELEGPKIGIDSQIDYEMC